MDILTTELIGVIVGVILTLFVFSYLIGDNFLFRFAIHIFIGATAGYVAVIILRNVIFDRMIQPLLNAEWDMTTLLLLTIPIILSGMLLTKIFPRVSSIGTPVMALLVGVGAATAVGGAVSGTLIPQSLSSINLFGSQLLDVPGELQWLYLVEAVFILIGTLTTLIFFHFRGRQKSGGVPQRPALINGISRIGRLFIATTFGALFAGALLSALNALVDRWTFIIDSLLAAIR